MRDTVKTAFGLISGDVLAEPPSMTIERPLRQRVDPDELENQIRKAPKAPIRASEVYGFDSKLTLAQALQLLEQNGGQVKAGDHGTLEFSVSVAAPHHRRQRCIKAARVLDAARPIVHACLTAKKPLPDRRPAAGGGTLA